MKYRLPLISALVAHALDFFGFCVNRCPMCFHRLSGSNMVALGIIWRCQNPECTYLETSDAQK